jgi:hypothetical protein
MCDFYYRGGTRVPSNHYSCLVAVTQKFSYLISMNLHVLLEVGARRKLLLAVLALIRLLAGVNPAMPDQVANL